MTTTLRLGVGAVVITGVMAVGLLGRDAASAQASQAPPFLTVGSCFRFAGSISTVYELQGAWARIDDKNPVNTTWVNINNLPSLIMMSPNICSAAK
jgi:hypothetical protein